MREGDDLPKKGVVSLRSTADIKAGDTKTILNINLWEGNIQFPITDNRFIGVLISGSDFDRGIIKTGDELICNYEINSAEKIHIEVSVPSIGATFEGTYSGEVNMPTAQEITENAEEMLRRIDEVSQNIDDSRLDKVREINEKASDTFSSDPESMMETHEDQLVSRRMLDEIRRDHVQIMRENELNEMKDFYSDMEDMQGILPSEIMVLKRLIDSAERVISLKSTEFEDLCDDFHTRSGRLLYWSQDWYVVEFYKDLIEEPDAYDDIQTFFTVIPPDTWKFGGSQLSLMFSHHPISGGCSSPLPAVTGPAIWSLRYVDYLYRRSPDRYLPVSSNQRMLLPVMKNSRFYPPDKATEYSC